MKLGLKSTHKAVPGVTAAAVKGFRLLKWDELVTAGDFFADGQRGFKPWEGPGGFRADAFVTPIYRRHKSHRTGTRKAP